MSMNTISTTFEGNLTRDPVLRTTNSGLHVMNCRIAVTKNKRTDDGEYTPVTQYMNIVAWRSLAVNAAASLKKGDRVIVAGDMRERTFQGNDGQTRYVTEVHCEALGPSLRWAEAVPHKTAGNVEPSISDEELSDEELYSEVA